MLDIIYFLLISYTSYFSIKIILKKPSNSRNWSKDQKILPYSKIKNNSVTIYNIRDFIYQNEKNYKKNYYNKTFNIDNLIALDFILVHLTPHWKGLVHTLISFRFNDNTHITCSIEIRKKEKDIFSPIKGLFRTYELMYVLGSENDIIKLRTNHRKTPLHIYPLNLKKEEIKKIFLEILEDANHLKQNPRFYNTLTDNCMTNLSKVINKHTKTKIKTSIFTIFPGYIDIYLHKLKLIKTKLPFKEAKKYHYANNLALKHHNSKDFSNKIRKFE